MNDIDVCLQGRGNEVDAESVSPINTKNAFTSRNNKSVKEIKTIERLHGTSTKPKGVLERRRKKKKFVELDEPSSQNFDCELLSFQSSQVQFSGFEHEDQVINDSNSQSQDQPATLPSASSPSGDSSATRRSSVRAPTRPHGCIQASLVFSLAPPAAARGGASDTLSSGACRR
ncbi:hypothetical protein VNO78_18144 [Psophocarpus tetragonolobus]|uniref:Uncharacterized protein n=1 Tax=Psophocarpus tetragonolobus TaxID=3891 RepID=A0AAN9SIT3_PSOTE